MDCYKLIKVLGFPPQAYHDPMLKLSIMSEEELTAIFGDLDAYIPLHEGEHNKPFLSSWFVFDIQVFNTFSHLSVRSVGTAGNSDRP